MKEVRIYKLGDDQLAFQIGDYGWDSKYTGLVFRDTNTHSDSNIGLTVEL
jgi:hypothetical protein